MKTLNGKSAAEWGRFNGNAKLKIRRRVRPFWWERRYENPSPRLKMETLNGKSATEWGFRGPLWPKIETKIGWKNKLLGGTSVGAVPETSVLIKFWFQFGSGYGLFSNFRFRFFAKLSIPVHLMGSRVPESNTRSNSIGVAYQKCTQGEANLQ